jgi:hypothetical protein
MSSEAQQNASRENGKKSHGATSEEGKAACCRNAVKHGLCARKILIHPLDAEAYDQCVATVFNYYKPLTDMEKLAIQEVATTTWKLQRVAVYESGLYAKGRLENKELFHSETVSPEDRHLIVEAHIQHTYSKSFTNLSLQQSKAQTYLEKKVKEFEKYRAEREVLELAKRKIAMESVLGDQEDTRPPHHTVGTVFSIYYLAARVEFRKVAGEKNLAIFDRAWGDFMAKVPA